MQVKELLDSLPKNETVYYRANPGNAGDALIASGAFLLFEQAGLEVELINIKNFDATNKIVLYAGGGNLVGIYPEARDFFYKFHKAAKQLILLPHTVTENEDLLAELGGNVTLFARELVSYEHLKKHAKKANVYLDHDLALNLDAKQLAQAPRIGFLEVVCQKIKHRLLSDQKSLNYPRPQIMLRNAFVEGSTFVKKGFRPNVGNFFRSDVERSGIPIPRDNADLSRVYEYGTHAQSLTDYTTKRMLAFIDKFDLVRTDRLHVCIGAALLGKKVEFYPNSYFKCRAVYQYSLKDKFQNVKWVEPDVG